MMKTRSIGTKYYKESNKQFKNDNYEIARGRLQNYGRINSTC